LASIRPALATRSGAAPRIGIYSPDVGNTLGGFASHWHLFARRWQHARGLLLLAKSLDLSRGLSIAASAMSFRPISLGSLSFSCRFSIAAGLTGEFASLEEPTDDPDLAIILVLLVNGPDFAGSKRQVEPEGPT
jgi:hypothetical protein